jgi:hypothetical protein
MEIQKIEIRRDGRRFKEKKKSSPKIYIFIENETLMRNLMNRRDRPYKTYKEHIIPDVMDSISKTDPNLFERIKDVNWHWDKNCGCSLCPCSPGFIGEGAYSEPSDIYVTII